VQARAAFRNAWINNNRNAIVSPVDGYAARRQVQVGQRVQPGQDLLTVVPLVDLWVDANFKETQLEHIRIGQPVKVTTDIYSGVTYHGKVIGLNDQHADADRVPPAAGRGVRSDDAVVTNTAAGQLPCGEATRRVGVVGNDGGGGARVRPILGGWITDNYHWSWIFFINVPVGIFALQVKYTLLKNRESKTFRVPIDAIGLFLLALGIGSLQFMLDNGNNYDWFSSKMILTLAIIAVVCLTFLIAWELLLKNPVINLQLFTRRNFTVGVFCLSAGMFAFSVARWCCPPGSSR
jgi:hypothetical protein